MNRILTPSILVLLVTDLVPVLGILFWNWDLFLLLVLYWSETAIIGFWMAFAAVRYPPDGEHRASIVPIIAFFTVHAGGFMAAHLFFLWALFAGQWTTRIHSMGDFLHLVVFQSGLWLPLLAMFTARGVTTWLDRAQAQTSPPRIPPIFAFYARIVVMHVTIIAGGILLQNYGNIAPLLILIGLKITIDTGFEVFVARKQAPAAQPG